MADPLHVVNAADAAYVPHTSAMLHSLFMHNPGEELHVHFLHKATLDLALVQRLAALCRRHGARFSATPVTRAQLHDLPIGGRFPEEAWYRVVLPELLPDLPRMLWLDSDVIVRAPIRELWDLDLAGCPLAACPNAVMFTFRHVIQDIGVADRRKYFNSGVMLMNLDQMRAEGSLASLRAAAQRAAPAIMFADQDVLNIVYHERYRRLHLMWNVLAQSYINVPETIRVHGGREYEEAMRHPRIIHFTGRGRYKPWFYTCSHPHRDEYLRHRLAAGWPPPDYPDKNWRTFFARQIPPRMREVFSTLRRRKYDEMLSYLRPW